MPMFQVLGDVAVVPSSQVVLPRSRRVRCLLGLLLLELGRPVAVDRLIRLLWDNVPPASADNMVHNNVSRLRQILAPAPEVIIRTIGRDYQLLADPNQIDLHLFRRLVREGTQAEDNITKTESLRTALSLWRGSPLAGVVTESARYRLCVAIEEEREAAQRAYDEAMTGPSCPAAYLGEPGHGGPLDTVPRERITRFDILR